MDGLLPKPVYCLRAAFFAASLCGVTTEPSSAQTEWLKMAVAITKEAMILNFLAISLFSGRLSKTFQFAPLVSPWSESTQ